MEIGLARGKKLYDKRQDIAEKGRKTRGQKETLKSGIWVKSLFSAGKGDAVKERRAPIFVTLSL